MLVAAAAASFLVGVVAAPAAAAPPDKTPRHLDSFVLSDTCQGFDVRTDQDLRMSTSRDLGGGLITTTGAITGTFTRINPDGSDGASVRINFSGPGIIDTVNGVVYARGPWAISRADDPATSEWEGALLLIHGVSTFNVDFSTGDATFVGSTAPVRDLCAELS